MVGSRLTGLTVKGLIHRWGDIICFWNVYFSTVPTTIKMGPKEHVI